MRLRHIEAFNAIMVTGSVSGAARWMNLSQPAVTRILQHAESHLGYALFKRAASGMTPTERALRLFPQVERLYLELNATREHAQSLRTEAKTMLHVSVVPALSLRALPVGVDLLRQSNPSCELAIQTQHSSAILSSVALGEIDVGLTFDVKPHPNVLSEILHEATLVCIAPRGEFKRRKQITLKDLANRPVVRLDIRDPLGQLVNRMCNEANVSLSGNITVQTYHMAQALVERGIGFALVDSITASSANRQLVDVLNLVPAITIAVKALRPVRTAHSSTVERFLAVMRTALGEIS